MQVALADPNAEPLRESQRQLNRGQAEQLRLLVDYVESFLRDTAVIEPELMRSARGHATAESAAIMNAAEALGASEGHVYTQYQQACFARHHLPRVWGAVRAGDVPVRSLVRVISAAERLVAPLHRERLDAEAATYALTHRPARPNAWLNRFVARMEPDQHVQRCRRSHAERRVWLEHLEDGVSILHAMLPTLTAEAIKNRLVDVARNPRQDVPYDPCVERPVVGRVGAGGMTSDAGAPGGFDWLGLPGGGPDAGSDAGWEAPKLGPAEDPVGVAGDDSSERAAAPTNREAGDPRTQAQREADLVSHWLLAGQSESGTPINAHVGILIEPETLLSGSGWAAGTPRGAGQPALSRNRRHAYPAEMIRRIILSEEHQITWTPVPAPVPAVRSAPSDAAPAPPDVASAPHVAAFEPLIRVYESRFVPKLLRRAIELRDGTCQAPGCMVAAEHCDIDHQIPWPHGQTTAANLWALCRKHHRLKTAGFLDVPADRPPPASP
ncbi:HNH endonuclease [Nesterenkonia sp. AY15]|uniref:HNH endonuclease signature motif containing protein n=1 Tax=Nesterenkonia sp. AY15 TaxID=2901139 RepID=UPI001F4CBE81|nr:HNH endonuclease signature motif containing protein [Nesterenkonia sp. AY15]MCH8569871.1 HNH endonuclease [Nesterenkonia sp. AY15]